MYEGLLNLTTNSEAYFAQIVKLMEDWNIDYHNHSQIQMTIFQYNISQNIGYSLDKAEKTFVQL